MILVLQRTLGYMRNILVRSHISSINSSKFHLCCELTVQRALDNDASAPTEDPVRLTRNDVFQPIEYIQFLNPQGIDFIEYIQYFSQKRETEMRLGIYEYGETFE